MSSRSGLLLHHLAWVLGGALCVLCACGTASQLAPGDEPASLQPEGWDSDVAAPVAEDLNPEPDVVEVSLEAKPVTLELRPGQMTTVWSYNGTVPGPTLRVRKGDRLVVHFRNNLPEATTLHWHGVRVPAAMDGTESMQTPVPPGGTFDYAFTVLDAGTFWYHPHVRSSAQTGAGLYGAFVVEDPEEPRFGDEVTLVLSDISLEAEGSLSPADQNGSFGDYFGREGNVLLVNGKVTPTLHVRQGAMQRWRLINAARSRYQKLQLPGTTFVRVGGDGGLVETPQKRSEVVLAPGERADVVLVPTPQPEGPVSLLWLDANRFNIDSLQPPQPLMTVAVEGDPPTAALPAIPAHLRHIVPIDVTGISETRFDFTEGAAAGDPVLGINGKTAEEADPLHVRVGERVLWTVRNATNYEHPFHLHGFFFQVLSIDGVAPSTLEWKDTVNLPAQKEVRLAVEFDNRPGMWMFHCHILDHADMGMMAMLMLMP